MANSDPLFMVGKNEMLLDSQSSYHNNFGGGDGIKYFQIKETFRFGFMNNLEFQGSLGFGHLKIDNYKEWGLTDPEFVLRYRVKDDIAGDWVLDVFGLFSPSLFDSPFDSGPNGVAKGSNDLGLRGLMGKRFDEWTFTAYADLAFIGSTDATDSATDLYIGAEGKYYMDDINSLDGNVEIGFIDKRMSGDDRDTAVKFAGGYSRVLAHNLDIGGMAGFITHSGDDLKGEIFLGARLRWQF
jgi:hypothetical protein